MKQAILPRVHRLALRTTVAAVCNLSLSLVFGINLFMMSIHAVEIYSILSFNKVQFPSPHMTQLSHYEHKLAFRI